MRARVRMVIFVVLLAALAAGAAPSARAASPLPTLVPDTLTVGLQMPTQGFQVGAVVGTEVVYARGLEVDLAGALAQRLGLPNVRFVQERTFPGVFAPGAKAWDVLFAQVTITAARHANVDFSVPYLKAAQGVLLRKELRPRPRTLRALRGLKICAQQGTTGQDAVFARIRPTTRPALLPTLERLLRRLDDRSCDAVVSDAPILGAERAAVPDRYGPLAGQIATNERYGAVLPKGSPLGPAVDDALRGLVRDGIVAGLSRHWLSLDVARLPVLR